MTHQGLALDPQRGTPHRGAYAVIPSPSLEGRGISHEGTCHAEWVKDCALVGPRPCLCERLLASLGMTAMARSERHDPEWLKGYALVWYCLWAGSVGFRPERSAFSGPLAGGRASGHRFAGRGRAFPRGRGQVQRSIQSGGAVRNIQSGGVIG